MRKFLWLILAGCISFAAPSFALNNISANLATTITANGDYLVTLSPYGKQLYFEFDYIGAGTGTITLSGCRLAPNAPFIAPVTTFTSVTADALRYTTDTCETYQLHMASCSSCNVAVYSFELRQ